MAPSDHPSVCTLDCPDTCSLTVTVEDQRITKVRGSKALPYTAGVICNKVAHHTGEFVHGPGRILHPLQRVGPTRIGRRFAASRGTTRWNHSRPGQRRDRPLGSAGGDAAELCRSAWIVGGRQHVPAVLPQARRDTAVSPGDVRRRAQRSLGRHLWCGARHWPRRRGPGEAEHRLGQQCDRHQPASRAAGSHGAAAGRPPGRHRPDAQQDRRTGRPAPGDPTWHGRSAGVCPGGRTGTPERPRPAVSLPNTCWATRNTCRRRGLAGRQGRRRMWRAGGTDPHPGAPGWPRPTRW